MRTYEPKILYNPTGKTVEFRQGHRVFIFGPGEKKLLDGFIAYHALKEVNTGLVEYEGQESTPGAGTSYEEMPWKKLVSLASKEGIKTFGMNKEQLIKAMEELDASKEGALQEPATEEKE